VHYERVHNATSKGFDIVLSFAADESDPNLIARVQAFFCNVELASVYLGGCDYESAQEFVKESGYFDDMVREAVQEAEQNLAMLTALAPERGFRDVAP